MYLVILRKSCQASISDLMNDWSISLQKHPGPSRVHLMWLCYEELSVDRDPKCGSDGKTYGNTCQMKEESCRQQKPIIAQPMDNCEGINTLMLVMNENQHLTGTRFTQINWGRMLRILLLPLDIAEEMCDGSPPLTDPSSGLEIDCSTGRETCPAGSYCHYHGGIARCCSHGEYIYKSLSMKGFTGHLLGACNTCSPGRPSAEKLRWFQTWMLWWWKNTCSSP